MPSQRPRPTRRQHIDQANANERLSFRLQSTDPEWALTILFYAALHWMSAYLGTIGLYPANHALRRRDIGGQPELAEIGYHYRFLQIKSEAIRYDCESISGEEVADFRAIYFDPLKRTLRALLDHRSPPTP